MDGQFSKTSDIELVSYKDTKAFRSIAVPWLLDAEDLNNALIGMINLLAEGSRIYQEPYFLGTLAQHSQLVGCCAFARPDGLLLSEMSDQAARVLFKGLDPAIGLPQRIVGPPTVADLVATKLQEQMHARKTLQTVWKVWRIDEVPGVETGSNGQLRLGTSSDEQLVADWGSRYGEEKPNAPVDISNFMLRKLRRNELFVWEDSGPATILTLSGHTDNGVKISAVFTPEEKRGAGHATSAVASLVEKEIQAGKRFLTLVTEDGDNHVDRMYGKLGFKKIGKRHCYALDPQV